MAQQASEASGSLAFSLLYKPHGGMDGCNAHSGFMSKLRNPNLVKLSSFKEDHQPQLTLSAETDIIFTFLVSKYICLLPRGRSCFHGCLLNKHPWNNRTEQKLVTRLTAISENFSPIKIFFSFIQSAVFVHHLFWAVISVSRLLPPCCYDIFK